MKLWRGFDSHSPLPFSHFQPAIWPPIIHNGDTMKTISATNLRVQLRDLLADLDSGPVSITKHGKVVAVLSAPGEPVEAVEATPTTEDTTEPPDASQSPPEPADEAARWGTEEAADPLDEFEQRIEDIDAEFEAYLSSQARMDRPMP